MLGFAFTSATCALQAISKKMEASYAVYLTTLNPTYELNYKILTSRVSRQIILFYFQPQCPDGNPQHGGSFRQVPAGEFQDVANMSALKSPHSFPQVIRVRKFLTRSVLFSGPAWFFHIFRLHNSTSSRLPTRISR